MGEDKIQKKKFGEAAANAGLKPVSVNKLAEEDFDSIEAIQAMTTDDVESIGLTRGQTRLLQKWIIALHPTESTKPVVVTDDQALPGTSAKTATNILEASSNVSRDQEIQQLLDLLTSKTNPGTATLLQDQTDDRALGKPLFIRDFVTQANIGRTDDNDTELCTQGNTRLLIRSTRQKPQPENISLAQWISANALIMSHMIRDGKLNSQEAIWVIYIIPVTLVIMPRCVN